MFAREFRLRSEGDVQRARSRGRAWADGPIVFRVALNPSLPDQNRYTVVAGKKVGKAVQRNRAKRVVREALRLRHPDLRTGHDIVVIVRGTYDQIPDLATAQPIVERIIRRAGLLASPSTSNDPPMPGSSMKRAESVTLPTPAAATLPTPDAHATPPAGPQDGLDRTGGAVVRHDGP
jgi:ribonuclease P protein component